MPGTFPAIRSGVSFGLTSGIITTLGLLVGLGAGTNSTVIVMGGVITIAIADAFSDALGVHMFEESRESSDTGSVWRATIAAFLAKFLFALSFVIPVALFPLDTAVLVSVAWGGLCIVLLSAYLARQKKATVLGPVLEHLVIAAVVVILSHYVGTLISEKIGT
jgi:vacuolar iron transporter family protein